MTASAKIPGRQLPEFPEELQQQLVQLLKLLADEKRLRIMLCLGREGELHVSHLCERLEQNQPAVSHHLALMRDAGLVESRRDGRHSYYAVCPAAFREVIDALFDLLADRDGKAIQLDRLVVHRQRSASSSSRRV